MTNGNAGIRHILLNHFLDTCQVVDAWIDEIHLSVARHLKINSVRNNFCTKGVYLRLDGIAVGRRCLDDAQVAGSNQRELQRSGDRRCTHRQRVNVGFHLAQLLFCRYAKLLLFIYNEQPQISEFHVLTDKLVGTYQDVYLAISQVFQYGCRLLGTTGSREIFHPDRQVL